jgi:hypothetical protein
MAEHFLRNMAIPLTPGEVDCESVTEFTVRTPDGVGNIPFGVKQWPALDFVSEPFLIEGRQEGSVKDDGMHGYWLAILIGAREVHESGLTPADLSTFRRDSGFFVPFFAKRPDLNKGVGYRDKVVCLVRRTQVELMPTALTVDAQVSRPK